MSVEEIKNRSAIYARISGEGQSEFSLPSQIRRCREKINKDGAIEVCGPFIDQESGFDGSKRNGFSDLFESAREEKLDYVYVIRIDRLGRHYAETPYQMYRLKEMGVVVRDLVTEYNFDDPLQYVIVTLLCNQAHAESVKIGERGNEGKIEKLLEGKWVGQASFGYRINAEEKAEIFPEMEPIIKDFFQTYLEIGDVKLAAIELTRRYSDKVGKIKPDKLGRILRNSIYVGIVKWGSNEIPMPSLRIISNELWQNVQTKLNEKSRPHKSKEKKKPFSILDDFANELGKEYLLCFLKEFKAICPKCGLLMNGNGNKKVLELIVPNFKCTNIKCKHQKTIPDAKELKFLLKDHISCPVCRSTENYDKITALDGSVYYSCKRCKTDFHFTKKISAQTNCIDAPQNANHEEGASEFESQKENGNKSRNFGVLKKIDTKEQKLTEKGAVKEDIIKNSVKQFALDDFNEKPDFYEESHSSLPMSKGEKSEFNGSTQKQL